MIRLLSVGTIDAQANTLALPPVPAVRTVIAMVYRGFYQKFEHLLVDATRPEL
jgi:hypothetical protein